MLQESTFKRYEYYLCYINVRVIVFYIVIFIINIELSILFEKRQRA